MGYLLAALLGGFFYFNSQATPSKAEHAIERVLKERFPGARVAVDMEGKRGLDVVKGRFRNVTIELAQFDAKAATGFVIVAVPSARSRGHIGQGKIVLSDFSWNNLEVGHIELGLSELSYDWQALKKERKLKIVSSGPVGVQLAIPIASLQSLIAARMPNTRNLRLMTQDGRVVVEGESVVPVLNTTIAFTLTSLLEVRNGNEIWLTDTKLTGAGGQPIAADTLLRTLNPIYVVDRDRAWPYRVEITSIRPQDAMLEMAATLTFVPAPAAVGQAPMKSTPALAAPSPAAAN